MTYVPTHHKAERGGFEPRTRTARDRSGPVDSHDAAGRTAPGRSGTLQGRVTQGSRTTPPTQGAAPARANGTSEGCERKEASGRPGIPKGMKFTPSAREDAIGRVAEGGTLAEAAEAAGVSTICLKQWLARGRREGIGVHADFEKAIVEARRRARTRPRISPGDGAAVEQMTAEEFRRHLEQGVRNGHVTAMRLWADRFLTVDEPERPASAITRLAERHHPVDAA